MPFDVLTHIHPKLLTTVEAAHPDVALHFLPSEGPIDDGIRAEVLLTPTGGTPNLARVMERGVRWVHTFGTGVNRFPFDALADDTLLTCARGASGVPIAEWAIAMMLAAEKDLPASWVSAPPERWNMKRLGTLAGSTLGIYGFGGIGQALATRALAFDMRVLATRRSDAPSEVEGVTLVRELAALVPEVDHLVVAAPATPETAGSIGAAVFDAVRPGLHLVNVARGELVDQDALRAALDDGRVGLASLDTVVPEPLPDGHWLYTHPRVRLSPHVSWSAPGAMDELAAAFIENIGRYRAGEPLLHLVDREARY